MKPAYAFLAPTLLLILLSPRSVAAQGNLSVYCSVQAEWCQAVANEFQRQTGTRVALSPPSRSRSVLTGSR